MVAYIDAFWFLFLVTLAVIPMLLFLRKPAKAVTAEGEAPMHLD